MEIGRFTPSNCRGHIALSEFGAKAINLHRDTRDAVMNYLHIVGKMTSAHYIQWPNEDKSGDKWYVFR